MEPLWPVLFFAAVHVFIVFNVASVNSHLVVAAASGEGRVCLKTLHRLGERLPISTFGFWSIACCFFFKFAVFQARKLATQGRNYQCIQKW